jgi:hypothetical protein
MSGLGPVIEALFGLLGQECPWVGQNNAHNLGGFVLMNNG